MNKEQRLQRRKQVIGSRHLRKLRKYSTNFNEMFFFFFGIYRRGVITFCGDRLSIVHNVNAPVAKECFRLYEDGKYKHSEYIETSQPNILEAVLIGKKGWGLWVDQWSDGIVDWTFTYEDIIDEFNKCGIDIPEPFIIEFENRIHKKKILRNEKYMNSFNI